MANRAKHAFGQLSGVQEALQNGVIDAFDILFLDGDTKPKIGWVDKNGNVRLVENETDLTELKAELATKISAEEVDAKLNEKLEIIEKFYDEVAYKVSHKPDGTVVDYRDKEIRIMCPANTQWTFQQSGENANPNDYYIGIKAYAPSDDVVSFKEDTKETIEDETMYYFEGEFAGIDADGRKYSIIWLPAASYDEANATWTYFGANSVDGKFIGWYYSVEWYDVNGKIVASDCIRINLSNEECHSLIEPFYMNNALTKAKAYTDKQINDKIAEVAGAIEVIEF